MWFNSWIMTARLLLLETSGRIGLVGLAEGEQLLSARRLDEARRHARDLAPAVAELLAERAWKPADLAGVIVSQGPGSYTGLRVGIMSAKTLAYAVSCALIAVETFLIVANQSPEAAEHVDVLADAQQDKLYVQSFARETGQSWRPASELAIVPASTWLASRNASAWVGGPGLKLVAERLPADAPRLDAIQCDPGLESLLRLGWQRYASGTRDDFWKLEPLYARPSSAEEKWKEAAP